MTKWILSIAMVLIATTSAFARGGGGHGGSHATSGYFRSSGTYVRPSGATNPNRTQFDNYSTKGNVNPYSGAIGTRIPRDRYLPPVAGGAMTQIIGAQ